MTSFRVYGPSRGFGSFRTITLGFLEGLRDLGQEVHFNPTDDTDDEMGGGYDGAHADVAVHLGWPRSAGLMMLGKHKKRFMMVAANSTVTGGYVFGCAAGADAELLTPSHWSKSVLAPWTDLPITVVPHGVLSDLKPPGIWPYASDHGERKEEWHVLHITSSLNDRKGTRVLVDAWREWNVNNNDGIKKRLTIATWSGGLMYWKKQIGEDESIRVIEPAMKYATMRGFYRMFDLIAQPSRAEGFGTVPLEALVCGVPAMSTIDTGQWEWANGGAMPGMTVVPTQVNGPIDDFEESMAPVVDERRTTMALSYAYAHRVDFRALAHRNEDALYEKWRWGSVLKPWVESLARAPQSQLDLKENT